MPCALPSATSCLIPPSTSSLFFFNDTATTEIYTLSLHDALPISRPRDSRRCQRTSRCCSLSRVTVRANSRDRKSTRLNSSHLGISYAVFCLKKKKKNKKNKQKTNNQ